MTAVFTSRWRLNLTDCADTRLVGVMPAGAGVLPDLLLSVGGQSTGFSTHTFAYAHPVITSVTTPGTTTFGVVPTTGFLPSGDRAHIVISGSNFGPPNASILAVVAAEGIAIMVDLSVLVPDFTVVVLRFLCQTRLDWL